LDQVPHTCFAYELTAKYVELGIDEFLVDINLFMSRRESIGYLVCEMFLVLNSEFDCEIQILAHRLRPQPIPAFDHWGVMLMFRFYVLSRTSRSFKSTKALFHFKYVWILFWEPVLGLT
jgi:hypothetical protein